MGRHACHKKTALVQINNTNTLAKDDYINCLFQTNLKGCHWTCEVDHYYLAKILPFRPTYLIDLILLTHGFT